MVDAKVTRTKLTFYVHAYHKTFVNQKYDVMFLTRAKVEIGGHKYKVRKVGSAGGTNKHQTLQREKRV